MRGKVVGSRIASHDEHGVRASNAGISGIVDDGILHSALVQNRNPFLRLIAKLRQLSELDGFGGARLRASWLKPNLLPVVTERAFERAAIILISLDYAERACRDAVSTAVANVGLNKHAAEFCSYDRAGRTCLKTSRVFAMLTDI